MLERIIAVVLLSTQLFGCSSLFPSAKTFDVYSVEVSDQPLYDADLSKCRDYALNYRPGFNFGLVGQQATEGALQNAPEAAVAPAAVALGAAGSGGSAALEGLGVLSGNQIRVLVYCMKRKTEMDHSALVLDPNG